MWMRNHNCCRCGCADKCTAKRQNAVYASLSGIFFGVGWWCFVDAACVHPEEYGDHAWLVLPGLGATAAFVVVNGLAKLPSMQMNNAFMTRTAMWCLRLLLFVGFFLAFSMIFAAALMFMLNWAILTPRPDAGWSYGFAIPQTVFIAIATFLYYFGVNIEHGF